jgi:uncharacterized protein with von Willebrand factor type A (vWA) domain
MWRLRHVEDDSLDRAEFARLVGEGGALASCAELGAPLLPHFRALLADLFASLYKLVRVRFPAAEMRPSVRVHGLVLDRLEETGALARLRESSELDVVRSALAVAVIAERVLDWLRRSRAFTGDELLAAFDAARREEELDGEAQAQAEAERLATEARTPEGRRALEREAGRRSARRAELARDLEAARAAAERAVDSVPREALTRLSRTLERAPAELERLELATEDWQTHVEGAGSDEARRRIELGRRLASSPKLAQLAALVGRVREQERALRRSRVPRRSSEIYAVGVGSDPGRLLPAELVLLGHPVARLDLARRLVEGVAQVYALRGLDGRGRGPLLVCLDTSSSMAGPKELWSKALALTLLHLARRRRRAFEVIAFSGEEAPLVRFPLVAAGGRAPDPAALFALAEHFPGGGTSFEKVLTAALERACGARRGDPLRGRADVVLISDGESSVSPALLARLDAARRKTELAILTVLVDVGSASGDSVARFSDRVVSVRELGADVASRVLLALD